MAIFGVWKNGYIGIDGTNYSDHAREITLDRSNAELPNDVHGAASNTAVITPGLESWTITATFLQDFAATSIDANMGTIFNNRVSVQVEVGPDSGGVGTSNPRYSGMAVLTNYRPLSGPHGTNLETTVTFQCASNLTRRTS